MTHALIMMLITLEKYNYEAEEVGIDRAMKRSEADLTEQEDMFSVSSLPPFNEIQLMKELVEEFG